jgi:toxin CcdB
MIHQFDVYATPLRRDKLERPYVLVMQSDLIDKDSRVCAPMVAERFLVPMRRLNPIFEIEGHRYYLNPVDLITLPVRALRTPILNLEAERYRIISAIDLVFTGI